MCNVLIKTHGSESPVVKRSHLYGISYLDNYVLLEILFICYIANRSEEKFVTETC